MGLVKRKNLFIPLIIFVLTFGIYLANLPFDYSRNLKTSQVRRLLTSNDLVPNTFLPYLILKYKTTDFSYIQNDLQNYFQGGTEKPYYFIRMDDKYISSYPILTGVLAVPFYAVPIILNKIPTLMYHRDLLKVLIIGRVTASFYAALSVVLMYFILDKIAKDKTWKYVFTIFYALGTLTWTISSRGLWQHTISQLLISLVVLILLNQDEKPALIPLTGLLCGLSVLARPTNAIFSAVIAFYIFAHKKKYFRGFVLYTIPTIVAFFLYNWLTFGSPISEGYSLRGNLGWAPSLIPGLLGFLFSPARSLLFISPPLVLSFAGIAQTLTTKDNSKRHVLLVYLAISYILSFLLMAKWWGWDGSNAFGYRMLTDFLPLITLFAYKVSENFNKTGKMIIIFLILYSIYVQVNAVIFRKSRCDKDHNWSFYCLQPPKRLPEY